MKSFFRNPGFEKLLISFVLLYTVYDYFEHILIEDSEFSRFPIAWLLFSLSSVLFFIITVILINRLLSRQFGRRSLLFEIVAIGIWLCLHIYLAGPFFQELFWHPGGLRFSFSFSVFFIILGVYFLARIAINLLLKREVFYSR